MTLNGFRNYCLTKKGVEADFPFDEKTLVMRVMGKMFAITNVAESTELGERVPAFYSINLKFDPESIHEIRSEYDSVVPGYHMNKNHWSSVIMDGTIDDRQIMQWIDSSYHLIVSKMTAKLKQELDEL